MKQQKTPPETEADIGKTEVSVAKIGLISAVVVAIITVIGTAISAYFSSQAAQAPILIPIQATQTAEAKMAAQIAVAASPSVTAAPTAVESVAGVKGDFSTPASAVETFIAAGVARDLDLLSQVFSSDAPAEFDFLRNKTASNEELDGLAAFVEGAEITGVRISNDQTAAVVAVKFRSRDEEISLIKTVDGWKIVDF